MPLRHRSSAARVQQGSDGSQSLADRIGLGRRPYLALVRAFGAAAVSLSDGGEQSLKVI
jgi:hypothetical protein